MGKCDQSDMLLTVNYHLRTSLTLGANGFETYELQAAPITLSFFLREFNVSGFQTAIDCAIDTPPLGNDTPS